MMRWIVAWLVSVVIAGAVGRFIGAGWTPDLAEPAATGTVPYRASPACRKATNGPVSSRTRGFHWRPKSSR